ncbi:hypothetical protein Pen01_63170 [Phytomonospora endophytica]|nr:hypothetical protein Pen01_63170 [Phytomonospora endophytica]
MRSFISDAYAAMTPRAEDRSMPVGSDAVDGDGSVAVPAAGSALATGGSERRLIRMPLGSAVTCLRIVEESMWQAARPRRWGPDYVAHPMFPGPHADPRSALPGPPRGLKHASPERPAG